MSTAVNNYSELEDKIISQDAYSRRENLIVNGLPEDPGEDCIVTAQNLFIKMDVGPCQVQRCHRLGQVRNKNPRPLIIRFVCFQDKIKIMKNRSKLKGTNIFVNDDYPREIEKKRAVLRPLLRFAKKEDPRATLIADKLRLNGAVYSLDAIRDSPLDVTKVGTLSTQSNIMSAGEFSPLSNLYPCTIITPEIVYNSSEQYFQAEKCVQLKRPDIAQLVIAASTGREAMEIGKVVHASKEWSEKEGLEIMNKVILCKFEQVKAFKELVKSGNDKCFVEASRNTTWGIGMPFNDIHISDPAKWKGDNLMGNLLNNVCKGASV